MNKKINIAKKERSYIKKTIREEAGDYFNWYHYWDDYDYDYDYDYEDDYIGYMVYWFEIRNASRKLIGFCDRDGTLICRVL